MHQHYPTLGPDSITRYNVLLVDSAMRDDGTTFKDHEVHKVYKYIIYKYIILKLLNLKQHNMGCGGSGPASKLMLSMGGLGKCSKTRFTLK